MLAASAANAQDAIRLEAGVGASLYSKGPDGLYFQQPFPHEMRLEVPAFEVGFTGPLYQRGDWGVDWHADWAWLGSVKTTAMAVPLDDNYNTAMKACNGPCLPLAKYVGSGHAQAFMLALEPHYNYGKWRFGIQFGPTLHKSTWTVDVSDIRYSQAAAPFNLRAPSEDGWRFGTVVGATVSYGQLSIAYQHFFMKPSSSNMTPPVWHSVDLLMLRYRF